MNPAEALAWLYSTQLHGIKLSLDPVRSLLALFPEPQPLNLPFLHVAGTNGKGSVCALLDCACRTAGLHTGLYTSPHLVHFTERIRVNGEPIPSPVLAQLLSRLHDALPHLPQPPTFFELATVAALAHFASEQTQVAILETGMGGRLDATNVVTPLVSILTPIGLDHQQWLGDSLEAIAHEKAGIIKPGRPAISAPQPESVLKVFRETARSRNAPFEVVEEPYQGPLGLAGSHQKWNAALAARALALSGLPVSSEHLAEGFRRAIWPGRFQELAPGLILDGAHNPHAANQLASVWTQTQGGKKAHLILGMMRDKDVAGFCSALAHVAADVRTVSVQNDRSLAADELAGIWRTQVPGIPAQPAESLAGALQECPRPCLITGSLFLAGETLALLDGDRVEKSAQ